RGHARGAAVEGACRARRGPDAASLEFRRHTSGVIGANVGTEPAPPSAGPAMHEDDIQAQADMEARASARLGAVLKEKYRLDRILGFGAMATVYAATHRNGKE